MGEYIQQLDLFCDTNPPIKLKGKVKLIELFAGIGSQYFALKLLEQAQGENKQFSVEHHKICEWAYNSYIMYNQMHLKDFTDYSANKTKEEMLERIKGTSVNYNEPLTMDQLKKKPIEWIRKAYNSCIATHNLVDISNVKGEDLDFDDNQNEMVIMSYSFPCQDISLAGQQKGLNKGSNTRSGLLWQVERLLLERAESKLPLPNILLMENVSALLSQNHLNNFKSWEMKLASLGYTNYVKILDTAEYGGIPQHRERVFMVSLLNNQVYNFPAKLELKHSLSYFLNKNVEEKYYLNQETIDRITAWKSFENPIEKAIDLGKKERKKEKAICPTITTRVAESQDGGMSASMKLIITPNSIPIKNNTEQGYLMAEDGDGVNIGGRMEYQRGNVQKGKTQTITTGGADIGVVVNGIHEKKSNKDNQ